jgi:hypothetical protein
MSLLQMIVENVGIYDLVSSIIDKKNEVVKPTISLSFLVLLVYFVIQVQQCTTTVFYP